jgi:hypothetical protein
MLKQNFLAPPLPDSMLRKSVGDVKAPQNCLDQMQRSAEQYPNLITARKSMPDLDSSNVLGLSSSPLKLEVLFGRYL